MDNPTNADLAQKMDKLADAVAAGFAEVHEKIGGLEERIGGLEEKMDARFEAVDKRFEQLDARFDELSSRLDIHVKSSNRRIQSLEHDVEVLKT